jgi:hypothetical protein
MKKYFFIFLLAGSSISNLLAAIVDCGCAFQGSLLYDVQIEYQGNGDCCHPIGSGTWVHLDSITNEILGSGHLNSGDAAATCQDVVGSLGC